MVKPEGSGELTDWADIYETVEGGAIVCMDFLNHLEALSRADARLKEMGIEVEMKVNQDSTAFVLVDELDRQIPFDLVMKTFFD